MSSQSNSDVIREIARLIERNFDSFRNDVLNDPDDPVHPDGTIWDVFLPDLIRGAEARRKFREGDHAQMRARGPLTLTVENLLIDAWDNTALARYHVVFSYRPPNATSGVVRTTDVFRRIDGRWRRVHHHEGMMPTGVPPITEPKA